MGRTRNPSGSPETTADRKFWNARESGYKGPIDRYGNKVESVDKWLDDERKKR